MVVNKIILMSDVDKLILWFIYIDDEIFNLYLMLLKLSRKKYRRLIDSLSVEILFFLVIKFMSKKCV